MNKYTNRSTNISCACYGGYPGGMKDAVIPKGITLEAELFQGVPIGHVVSGRKQALAIEVDGWSYYAATHHHEKT